MMDQLAAGKITVAIERSYPFGEVAAAFARSESGHARARSSSPSGDRAWPRGQDDEASVVAAVLRGAICAATGAPAEVRTTERVEPLPSRAAQPGPARPDEPGGGEPGTKVYDANTASNLRWSFTYRTTSDDCRIAAPWCWST